MDLLQSHEKKNFGLTVYSGFVIYDVQVKDVEVSCLLWFKPFMLCLACNLYCLIGKDLNYTLLLQTILFSWRILYSLVDGLIYLCSVPRLTEHLNLKP